jgi:hypothetical protein
VKTSNLTFPVLKSIIFWWSDFSYSTCPLQKYL